MNELFLLNPKISKSDIHDAIDERITKIAAIASCLLSAHDSYLALNSKTIYDAIWIIDDYCSEIKQLTAQTAK